MRLVTATVAASALLLGSAPGGSSSVTADQGGRVSFPAANWPRYVVGPNRREVNPVSVVASTGDVVSPGALMHGGVTKLVRPQQPPPPLWPSGTTATASSFHAPNDGDSGQFTTYVPSNAIDGNPQTFWNDANPEAYPNWLEIDSPRPLTLPGITVLSNSDGVPEDFTVQALEHGNWTTVGTVTGNTAVQIPVRFAGSVVTSSIKINVTLDEPSPKGDFTRINEVWPAVIPVEPIPSVTLDFGKDVVGFAQIDFAGASGGNPGIRVAFSETRKFLTDRSDLTWSDYSGGPGTDQHAPSTSGPSSWIDTDGCQDGTRVCADGLHGFRYMKISLDAIPGDAPFTSPYGEVELDGASLHFSGYLGTPSTYEGWFESSDASLNRYWYGAAYTDELDISKFEPGSVDPRGAASPTLDGKVVLMDGAKRDRDPYDGDLAVSALTNYLTHGVTAAVTNVLADLANHQQADGYIPPASIEDYTLLLFEYPLYWVIDSWQYALYNGIAGYATRYYPNMVKLLNTWYPSVTDSNGLLDKGMNGTGGYGDYAFLRRSGEITYYNDLYVLGLKDASQLAARLGDPANATAWRERAASVASAINTHLWDPKVGAYLDSSTGPVSHPQDANGWAVVAGVARGKRAISALGYLSAHTQTPYGNSFYDNNTVVSNGTSRVYAFTSYPEMVGRFETGLTASALNEIDRLYGCMTTHDPGLTDWEGISSGCSMYEGGFTSAAHGWSTGVLPALTNELLGVQPTAPGFSQWLIEPHPGTVAWAEGQVPTPRGAIVTMWKQDAANATFTLQSTVPSASVGTIAVPAVGATSVIQINGKLVWNNGNSHGAPGVTNARSANGYLLFDVNPAAQENPEGRQGDPHPHKTTTFTVVSHSTAAGSRHASQTCRSRGVESSPPGCSRP